MDTSYDDFGDGFYRETMQILTHNRIPFLVGGAFALQAFTGVRRDTKDLDLMMRKDDVEWALRVLRAEGYRAGMAFSHWIAKIHYGEAFIDIIFNSGNGLCPVDDSWFENGLPGEVLGTAVKLCPPEELIWQKAYIMERERFDGADVMHLLRSCAPRLDWNRLLRRFQSDPSILFAHLVLFGFVYTSDRGRIPSSVLHRLTDDFVENWSAQPRDKVCNGTLLSRAQYLADIERWGFADGRESGRARITPEELEAWTAAIAISQRDIRPASEEAP